MSKSTKYLLATMASLLCVDAHAQKEISGVFLAGFELSLFEPCGNDEAWWLGTHDEIAEEFWGKVASLRGEDERSLTKLGMWDSSIYYFVAIGTTSERGHYGHLGAYDRAFEVSEFSEFRTATADEYSRCLTSGML